MCARWNGERRLRISRIKISLYVCKMFIHLSTRLWFRYSLRHAFIDVVCCRINQLNYLWWWINRFVFRWRAQLAALSTTNCRRIEWWNLERERVLGQSQCYSWFRGFFLTQLHASEVRDAVAIRDWLFLSEWWVGSLPSYQRISIPSVTLAHRRRVVTNRTESFAWRCAWIIVYGFC